MNIIITGASRGIGFDTALQLSSNSEYQILALSRNEEKLEKLRALSQEKFGHNNLNFLAYDLANPNSDELQTNISTWSSVDILINNAGLLISKPFEELSLEDWQSMYMVNLFSVVALVKQLLPQLRASKKAHILNIGSMGGFQGSSKFPGLSAYSSSKAALANLTECLAEELKEKNISANCLALGAVQTEMLEAAFPGYEAPLKSEEMASFVSYFATQGHQFYNGKVLPVSLSTP